jgi:hypothetical protein
LEDVAGEREGTIAGAYDLGPLDSISGIQRILEIATTDTLGLENGIARSRTLIAAAVAAVRLRESNDLDARLRALEAAHAKRLRRVDAAGDSLLDEDE